MVFQQPTVYTAVYASGAAVALVAAALAWPRRSSRGGIWLFLMLVAAAWWCLFDALESAAVGTPMHVAFAQTSYIGSMTVAVFLFLFALEYTGYKRPPFWVVAGLFGLAVLGIAGAFTNGWHHQLWTAITVIPGGLNQLKYYHGWVYWLDNIYACAVALIATMLLLSFAMRSKRIFKWQSASIVVAVMIPWLFEIGYNAGFAGLSGFDPSITMAASGALLLVSIRYFGLLDLAPVARETLIERMRDGLLVLGSRGRIIDSNPEAGRILGSDRAGWVGADVSVALSAWPALSEFLATVPEGEESLTIESPDGRSISVTAVALTDVYGVSNGVLATLRDITQRRAAEEALRKRTAELDALLKASRAMASSLDYDRVLHEVARTAGEALGSPECIIWEYAPPGDLALFRCLWERVPVPGLAESLAGTSYDISRHVGGLEALRAGEVVQLSRFDPRLRDVDREEMDGWGEKTWLTVPLVSARGLLGVMIFIESASERTFTPDEVRLVSAFGEQGAVAIDNARSHREQEERNRWLNALVEASRQVTSTLAMDELLKNIARLAAESVQAPLACIYEYDAQRAVLVMRSRLGADGVGRNEAVGSEHKLANFPGDRRALVQGEVFVKTRSDPGLADNVRRRMEADGEETQVIVPFRFAGEPLGMLVLIETEAKRIYTIEELDYLAAFGKQAAIAVNNARLYATVEVQAATDGLTGLANRRTFHERLDRELARARRYETPLSLLVLDIDDFKSINDTHGHQVGDEVLRRLARMITREVRRDIDLPARYGGEEFVVILPGTDVEGSRSPEPSGDGGAQPANEDGRPTGEGDAETVAERIRACIAATSFPSGAEGEALRVTASIGVAAYPRMADDARGLIGRADEALYAAKGDGKNAVRVYRD
ncbi:MAG: diguanylate cyclase [Actinomycetes bacterium]